MIDFETLGTSSDTICVSVGLCNFNKLGIIDTKLIVFDLNDQVNRGRSFTADTICWFMKQSDQARSVFSSKQKKLTIAEFFVEFESFVDAGLVKCSEGRDQLKPCGNGANFDISILEDLYRRHHPLKERGLPFRFWNVFCFRTFNTLTNCKDLFKRPNGSHHTADQDALYQANCMLAYWNRKKVKA